MNKFTIFTVILAVSVMTVMADLALRDYFEGGQGQASVANYGITELRNNGNNEKITKLENDKNTGTEANVTPASPQPAPSAEVLPIEPQLPAIQPPPANLTPELIAQAGFTGKSEEKTFSGKVYQLLDITKIPVDLLNFYEIYQDDLAVASVLEIALRDEIRALQLYSLLQNKTKPYIDLSLNETNAYGDRSFYINHAKKPNEAFLTVKIGSRIYAIAYVKFYHPEIKRLIQLLIP